jgi:uncharacterized protein YndB with AHSA1/START domain
MTATQTSTANREICTTRQIDAPRELVWKAWTDIENITNWWGPHGFSTTTKQFDFKVGGTWLFTMHGPDGRDYANRVVYSRIEKPARLSYKHMGEEEYSDILFEADVQFDEEHGKTRVTLRSVFATAQERDYVVENHGAIEGAQNTLQRFESYVATLKP